MTTELKYTPEDLIPHADQIGFKTRALVKTLMDTHEMQQQREKAIAEKELQLQEREKTIAGREEAVNQVSKLLSLERAKVKAGLDREKQLADKLEKTRAELGAKSAQLTKIAGAFPQLVQP